MNDAPGPATAATGSRAGSADRGRAWFDRIASVATGGVLTAVVLGFGGDFHWTLDLFAHQQRVYAVALVVLAAVLALRRRPIWLGLAVVGLGLTLFRLAPLYTAAPEPAAAGAPELKVVSMNVLLRNADHDAAAAAVRAADPDVLIVMEVDAEWLDALGAALPTLRIRAAEPRGDTFGIAVFSRVDDRNGIEVIAAHVIRPADTRRDLPAVEASLRLGGSDLALLALHPPPPIRGRRVVEHRAMLGAAAAWSQRMSAAGVAHLVVGDLNATPWSAAFRDLTAATELVNSQRSFGFGASWPVGIVSSLGSGIPIDHALHSPELTTVERTLGPNIGSDHYPLTVVIAPLP